MESFGAAVLTLLLGLSPALAVPATQSVDTQLAQAAGSQLPKCDQPDEVTASMGIVEQCLRGCRYRVMVSSNGKTTVLGSRYDWSNPPKGVCIVERCEEGKCTGVSQPYTAGTANINTNPYSFDTTDREPDTYMGVRTTPVESSSLPPLTLDPFKDVTPESVTAESNPFKGTPYDSFAEIRSTGNQSTAADGEYQTGNPAGVYNDTCNSPGCEVVPSDSLPSSFTETPVPLRWGEDGVPAQNSTQVPLRWGEDGVPAQNSTYAQPTTFDDTPQLQGQQPSASSPTRWSNFTSSILSGWRTFLNWF